MNEVFYSSIFGELTKQVQIRIDAASELRKRLFDQNIYERFLDWDTPTVGLNFEELIGSYNLSVAAATLDSKGKEPIMGTEGLETIKQKVLTHQMSYSMPIEEYRKVLQILDSRMLSDSAKTQQLINLMWNNVTKVVNSVQSKLDIIFLGALSNKGVFTFDASNNPEGGVRGTIDYKMPSENIATAKRYGRMAIKIRSIRWRIFKPSSMLHRTKLRSTAFCSRRNACRISSATRR